MKRLITILMLFTVFILSATCQKDKTFTVPVIFQQGIKFNDGTVQTTAATGIGVITWDAITGKPSTFPPATHNHNSLYRPISYVPTWSEITSKPNFATVATTGSYNDLSNKPLTEELSVAISKLAGVRIPVYTQTQINALTPSKGLLVFNDTDGILQIYNGTVWKNIITGN